MRSAGMLISDPRLQEGWRHRQQQHEAPPRRARPHRVGAVNVRDARKVGEQDAGADEQLREAAQRAADGWRSRLGNVTRHEQRKCTTLDSSQEHGTVVNRICWLLSQHPVIVNAPGSGRLG